MDIRLDSGTLSRAKQMLADTKTGFPRAFSRALNKTTTGVRTDMVALIRDGYNYKATAVRRRISIDRATYQNLNAAVRSTGGRVHLTDIVGTRQTARGVTLNVKKDTGRKLIPSGFIRPARISGKLVVFRRREINGKMVGRDPIDPRFAPHPEVVYNTRENWIRLERSAGDRLNSNFDHELSVVLQGIA